MTQESGNPPVGGKAEDAAVAAPCEHQWQAAMRPDPDTREGVDSPQKVLHCHKCGEFKPYHPIEDPESWETRLRPLVAKHGGWKVRMALQVGAVNEQLNIVKRVAAEKVRHLRPTYATLLEVSGEWIDVICAARGWNAGELVAIMQEVQAAKKLVLVSSEVH